MAFIRSGISNNIRRSKTVPQNREIDYRDWVFAWIRIRKISVQKGRQKPRNKDKLINKIIAEKLYEIIFFLALFYKFSTH